MEMKPNKSGKPANLRTALVLLSIAVFFFASVIINHMMMG